MFHHVAHAAPDQVLFRTWHEAAALWRFILRACPGPTALCLMPTHIHLLHAKQVHPALRKALGDYTQWRNAHRGTPERAVWMRPVLPGEPVDGGTKRRRNDRYVHANPCRGWARVCHDPLAWPFSTHRDTVGLTLHPVRRSTSDPLAYHQYVSRDAEISLAGTDLPTPRPQPPTLDEVRCAVSSLTRTPLPAIRLRGPSRTLLLRAARSLCEASPTEIAAFAGVCRRTVARTVTVSDDAVRLVARVAGDPRFDALHDHDLLLTPGWARYRQHRYR